MSDADKLRKIKMDFQMYKITAEKAKELAKPLLDRLNAKRAELAKKYNQKFSPFTLESFK